MDDESDDAGDGADGADDESDGAGICGSWDPDSYVWYNRSEGHYEVDQTIIGDITANPALLAECDSAVMRLESGGHRAVDGAMPSDLATQLGWRDGDKLLSVNGHILQWNSDYSAAYAALNKETSFTLKILRGPNVIVLSYAVTP